MKILITGSRGFLGGTIGRFAASNGHEVLGIGRAAQADLSWPGQYFSADVLSADLSRLIRDCNPAAIFHAAGTASVGSSFASPLDDLRASLLSWANLLENVRRSGQFPLLVYPSSAAVYGRPQVLPAGEDAPVNPISPYGFHKAACELMAREYATCFQQKVVIVRLFSVFGEAQRRLLIWELFQQFSGEGDTVSLEGTGKETRDYLYADNVADVVLRLIQANLSKDKANYQTINVGSGNELNVLSLAEQIRTLLGSTKKINCRGIHREGDPERWRADISLLRDAIPDWEPMPFKNGLEQCLETWRR